MRNVPEIKFPISILPHALVQVAALGVFVWLLKDQGMLPAVTNRLQAFVPDGSGLRGWYLPVLTWLVLGLLLGELVLRKIQAIAATIFPNSRVGFRLLTLLLVPPSFHLLFVTMECTWFWVSPKAYPAEFGSIHFYQGLIRTFVADAGMIAVFGLGEMLRQIWYNSAIDAWHKARRLRKQQVLEPLED